MAKSKEIAIYGGDEAQEAYPALSGEGDGAMIQEILEENFGDTGIGQGELDRVRIPAGGGTTWEVPTLDGTEPVRELEGIIVAWQSPRVYWVVDLDESDEPTPPDCTSEDGKIGNGLYGPGSEGNPSGQCEKCPMNQWGSADDAGDDGRGGKACKEQRLLYLLREGSILPVVVALPPTSIRPLKQYFLRLASAGIPYYGALSRLELEQAKSGGNTYSIVKPSLISRLEPTLRASAKDYGKAITANAMSRPSDVAAETYADGVHEAREAS